MGNVSNIAWTDSTFNGWVGCTEAGPGCDSCYARDLDARYQWGVKKGDRRTDGLAPHWGAGAPRYRTSAGNWRGPILWNKSAETLRVPRKVFAHSLSDVFDNEVPDEWRADLFALMKITPWLRWQVLTKRVPNIRKMLPADWGKGYPNVGLVATVVDHQEFERDGPRLLSVPARWHGFSVEPQLNTLGILSARRLLDEYPGSKWIITGGESAQKAKDGTPAVAREYDLRWARDIIRIAAISRNTYAFVKQTGARPIGCDAPEDGAGAKPERWPADIRVRDFVPELLA